MENLTANDVANIVGMQNGNPPVTPTPPVNTEKVDDTSGNADTSKVDPPVAAAPPVTTAGAPDTKKEDDNQYEEFDLNEFGFQNMDELRSHLNRFKEVEAENSRLSEYKNGPKFKSDRHKLLYDYGAEVEGMELSKARQYLDIVAMDLAKMPDQQIRFEAFKLKPENQGLTQDELVSLFKDDEFNRFGDPDNSETPQSETQKIRSRQATTLAKQELGQLQTKWTSARTAQQSPEEVAADAEAYRAFLAEQTEGFDGIQLDLVAQAEGGEKLTGSLNFKLDSKNQLPVVIEALADPNAFWDRLLLEDGILKQGEKIPDFKKFASLMTFIANRHDIINQVYQQGQEDALARHLKKARNTADPAKTTVIQETAKVNKPEKEQANAAAMKTLGAGV